MGAFDYVLGEKGVPGPDSTERSHAWLQRDDLIVDITADQFGEVDEEVIVTRDSEWHASWRTTTDHEADYEVYDESARRNLHNAYLTVLDSMPNSTE